MARTTIRIPMAVSQRAKQFAMFDALKGLTEAIAEKEKQYDTKRELSEDRISEIGNTLSEINPGVQVKVEYFCQYGSCYKEIYGHVKKIDSFWKELHIDDTSISFSEISSISFS